MSGFKSEWEIIDVIEKKIETKIDEKIRRMIELNEARKKYFYYHFLQRIFINFKFKEIRMSVYED